MKKRIPVIFTTITDQEWHEFKAACAKAGKPMTEVLWEGAQLYLKAKQIYIDPPYVGKGGRDDWITSR